MQKYVWMNRLAQCLYSGYDTLPIRTERGRAMLTYYLGFCPDFAQQGIATGS
jgi:hypothetical protein